MSKRAKKVTHVAEGMKLLITVSDKVGDGSIFESIDAFQDACVMAFGAPMHLEPRGREWTDETGETILEELDDRWQHTHTIVFPSGHCAQYWLCDGRFFDPVEWHNGGKASFWLDRGELVWNGKRDHGFRVLPKSKDQNASP